ncbi:MAG TPA: hypothetical protein VE713_10625 [Pyrinomonadaceae bacterium]|jgi:hypothetical protein|nr:hypothetical protein [Pyrinomonadaceae bacterium]
MYRPIKRFLVGNPISTAMAHHERLNNKTALALFSSNALSSVAYSTEARIRAQESEEEIHRTIDPGLALHELERIAAIERDRGSRWLLPTLINGAGAIVTFVALCIIAVTKLRHGAWAVVVVIGLIVLMFRSITTPLLDYIKSEARRQDGGMTTVVLPESTPARWRQHLLHNQTSFLIKAKLLFNPRVSVTSIPYHLRR